MLAYTSGIYEHKGFQMLGQKDLEAEFMILGLRMTEGVEDDEFRRRFDHSLDSAYGRVIDKYVKTGHMVRGGGRTRFTRDGMDVSNMILVDFMP